MWMNQINLLKEQIFSDYIKIYNLIVYSLWDTLKATKKCKKKKVAILKSEEIEFKDKLKVDKTLFARIWNSMLFCMP